MSSREHAWIRFLLKTMVEQKARTTGSCGLGWRNEACSLLSFWSLRQHEKNDLDVDQKFLEEVKFG